MTGNTIKLRAEVDPRGVASVRLLVTHPMLPERADGKSGKTLPPHHIEEITVAVNDETVLIFECGPGISANPFFSFSLTGVQRGDQVAVSWVDNQQQSDRFQAAIA